MCITVLNKKNIIKIVDRLAKLSIYKVNHIKTLNYQIYENEISVIIYSLQ